MIPPQLMNNAIATSLQSFEKGRLSSLSQSSSLLLAKKRKRKYMKEKKTKEISWMINPACRICQVEFFVSVCVCLV